MHPHQSTWQWGFGTATPAMHMEWLPITSPQWMRLYPSWPDEYGLVFTQSPGWTSSTPINPVPTGQVGMDVTWPSGLGAELIPSQATLRIP